LNVYEPVITDAISSSPFTSTIPLRIINQGVNGGTIKDLVRGFSPWGHLNPFLPQTNITFAETLDQDEPDIVHIQIGINDVLQAGSSCGERCSNVSEYVRVFLEEIATPLQQRNISFVIVSVSTIGELPDGLNVNDADLDAFATAQRDLATKLDVPFVNLRLVDELYESLNNCLPLTSGLLTYDGIHPLEPRGSINLANLHSKGLLQAFVKSNAKPKRSPYPFGGRVFITIMG
jgi:lysophospholipase L1-like esterase